MDEERNQLRHSFIFTIRLVAIPFVVFLITFIFSIDLSGFGVYAREVSGLKGIIFAPLVHGSWGHLLSNLPPLFVSVFMIHYFYRKYFWGIFLSCYLLTGLMVWLFGREVYHIGISGVVYALVSFLFFIGIFVRNLVSIVLSLVVLVMYSGMAAGLFPTEEILKMNISWESHLMGAMVGAGIAWAYRLRLIDDGKKNSPKSLIEEEKSDYYFNRDVFDRTKWDRQRDDLFNQNQQ
jgi:membrane associated rhomboid family serine protease